MSSPAQPDGRERLLGWSALGGSVLAVFAWAACCVLPMALSLAGLGLAGAALIAGQRTWLTVASAAVLLTGWWNVWRRRSACARGGSCRPPARATIALLASATALTTLALVWQPLIEPWALMLLRSLWR
ncbi:MAG: MFS transporter permease [Phenylobacterium sp.]|uniref:MFS transporter permease n=1 Tax=Phenylobacterium sp. TaxID=1871053 RepID=UPI001A30BB66|nr:MFS transporter permease [Phenylobacterium sp.]MBJ7412225.1 MFS transporter permease [Phenylobacterium sp.]